MRLLNTDEVRLQDFYGANTPPYAILSHRWGGEEVVLQDILRLRGSWDSLHQDKGNAQIIGKKGFAKLVKAVELARRNKLEFIWVDTCCIDKTSSAELSEAINSMYHWYEAADTCYAYLMDVKAAFLEDMFAPNSSFRQSNWFTRGWTLQELIAPSDVDFFASDWSYLGNKRESNQFVNMLQLITGVPHAILSGALHPTEASAASRMAWAANRETTRLEDVAYSLLGIFDVNMPLLYGEGEKAFIRLQEQILSQSDDETIFAWHEEPGDKALWGLLAARPSCFRDSGDLVPVSRLSLGVPWSLTSKGLEIKFGLREWVGSGDTKDADYYVMLNCSGPEASKPSPIIFLKRIWLDSFARVSPHAQTRMHRMHRESMQISPARMKLETVYVNQTPSQRSQYVRIVVLDSLANWNNDFYSFENADAVKVIDAHPRACWSGSSVTLKPHEFRLTEALALFRIDVKGYGIFEIATGLHLVNENECQSWCVQHRAGEESRWTVEDNFWVMNQLLRDKRVKKIESTSIEDVHGESTPLAVEVKESLGTNSLEIVITIRTRHLPPAPAELKPLVVDENENISRPFSDLEVITLNGMPLINRGHGFLRQATPKACTAFPGLKNMKSAKRAYVEVENPHSKLSLVMTDLGPSNAFSHDALVDWQASVRSGLHFHAICRRRIIPPLDCKAFYCRCFREYLAESDIEKVSKADLWATDSFIHFSALQWAILGRMSGTVSAILKIHPSLLSYVTPCGISAFHVAAGVGEYRILDELVENALKTQDVSWRTTDKRLEAIWNMGMQEFDTPLHFAAAFATKGDFWKSMSPDTMRFFSYYTNRANSWGLLPLELAALAGNMPACASLISGQGNQLRWLMPLFTPAPPPDAKVDRVGSMGRTLVWYAAYGNFSQLLHAEWQDCLPPLDLADDEGFAPIHVACMLGNREVLIALLDHGSNVNTATSRFTLLPTHIAAIYGQLESLKVLSRRNALEEWPQESPWEKSPYTAITLAVANRHFECARFLWEKNPVSVSGLVPCVVLRNEELCVETLDMTIKGGVFHFQRVEQGVSGVGG